MGTEKTLQERLRDNRNGSYGALSHEAADRLDALQADVSALEAEVEWLDDHLWRQTRLKLDAYADKAKLQADVSALEAENAELKSQRDDARSQTFWHQVQAEVVRRDAAEAQLAETEERLAEAREALRAAEFLCERLGEFEADFNPRDYFGHVEPALARMRAALTNASARKASTCVEPIYPKVCDAHPAMGRAIASDVRRSIANYDALTKASTCKEGSGDE